MTPEERDLVALANAATNELLARYGLPPLDVTPDHVHLLPHDAYQKLRPGVRPGHAYFAAKAQALLLSDRGPDERLEFAQTVFHEMVHFKFNNVLQVSGDDRKLQPYRMGLAVVSRNLRKSYFYDLNEAVTEDLTDEYFETNLKEHPLVEGELAARGRRRRGYIAERNAYDDVVARIAEKSGGAHTPEEVREAFRRAAATGNLLPLARLAERTLGPGSFRALAAERDIPETA